MSSNSTNGNLHGLALLEEWPRRESILDSEHKSSTTNMKKQVTFSAYSRARVYKCSSSYCSQMSYLSSDTKKFRAQASHEGKRIQFLISSGPPKISTARAMFHLTTLEMLKWEKLLGIEHYFVTTDRCARVLHERRNHSALVLRKQKELGGTNKVHADKLAQIAITSTLASVQRAQFRAALAL